MKTKIFKTVLPALVLMLAVFGAFAFKSTENNVLLAPVTGWINLPGQPCAIQVQCDDVPGPICTAIHQGTMYQAFGKTSEQPPICNKILSRPPM